MAPTVWVRALETQCIIPANIIWKGDPLDDTVHLQTIKGKHIFPHPWKHRFMYLGSKRMSTACPSNCGFRQFKVVEKSQDFNFELRVKKMFIYFIFYVCFFTPMCRQKCWTLSKFCLSWDSKTQLFKHKNTDFFIDERKENFKETS